MRFPGIALIARCIKGGSGPARGGGPPAKVLPARETENGRNPCAGGGAAHVCKKTCSRQNTARHRLCPKKYSLISNLGEWLFTTHSDGCWNFQGLSGDKEGNSELDREKECSAAWMEK